MQSFTSRSDTIHTIIKSANLTKTLFLSSIIIGDEHIGKKGLARMLLPSAVYVSANNQEEVEAVLSQHNEVIIGNFEKLSNHSRLNFDNKRIIATANYINNPNIIDELFSFIYKMPSLKERPEDVSFLAETYIAEAQTLLMLTQENIPLKEIPYRLDKNTKDLKKSIYMHLLKKNLGKEDIISLMHDYLYSNMEGNNNYKEHLELYEKPLIQAGLKKYTSQLKLSEVLGINRNTLRKKIHEQGI